MSGCWERSPLLDFAIEHDAGDLACRGICFAYDPRICSFYAVAVAAAEGWRWRTDDATGSSFLAVSKSDSNSQVEGNSTLIGRPTCPQLGSILAVVAVLSC